jgi:hypothetical protein
MAEHEQKAQKLVEEADKKMSSKGDLLSRAV